MRGHIRKVNPEGLEQYLTPCFFTICDGKYHEKSFAFFLRGGGGVSLVKSTTGREGNRIRGVNFKIGV